MFARRQILTYIAIHMWFIFDMICLRMLFTVLENPVLINVFILLCILQSRALQNNAAVSPFRRWGQSSFRTRHSEQPGRDYTQRRASSSESDFYLKVHSLPFRPTMRCLLIVEVTHIPWFSRL